MFTLKFLNTFENDDYIQTVISCQHYSVYSFKNRFEIILYKDYTSKEGVTYTVAPSDIGKPYFNICYIENIHGKTIDKIG